MSASPIPEFRRDLDRVLVKILGRSVRFQRALTLEALRRLVLRTPVDTGRARGSWQVTADAPPTSSPIAVDPNGGATITKGAQAAQAIRAGHDSYIVSNLVYMPALERGHSKQAPAGIVAVTAEEMKLVSNHLAARVASDEL